jgi:hypothetical protein
MDRSDIFPVTSTDATLKQCFSPGLTPVTVNLLLRVTPIGRSFSHEIV